ncbi:MAG: hypothetical protein A2V85_00260 [Chloroflexi bacterium RBG_16_72_14]|nr:MAG: hypothetical protein A2V85_00260 [Chloroflexi bacterium RBG_16_72_14]
MVHLTRRVIGAISGGLGRSSVRAAGLAALLVVLAVMPAAAGPTDLTSPAVSPTTGTTADPITFSVTFRSAKGDAPEYVRVVVGPTVYAMARKAGPETWKNGVRYAVTKKLTVGTWAVRFEARSGNFVESISGETVNITAAPKPKPTPEPTPRPTPRPEPAATPRPTPRPTEPPATAPPTPDPTAPGARPDPLDWPLLPGATPDGEQPEASDDPVTAGVIPGAGGGFGGSGGTGGTGGGDGTLPGGLGGPPSLIDTLARVLPTVVVTTGGVTMLMAFLAFGKRRRDEAPTAPDHALEQAAGRGMGLPGHSGLVPATASAAALAAAPGRVAAMVTPLAVDDVDAHLPRWRRPSLMEARKSDPMRTVSTDIRLSFEGEVGAAVDGMERRLIRYRLVSLLDSPDEVRGVEIGVLDEGDEVVLLEKRGTYWRVLCPDGRHGWLHKMTLGDVVIEAGAAGTNSWTSGDDGPATGTFEDMLRAYTERREQFGEAS